MCGERVSPFPTTNLTYPTQLLRTYFCLNPFPHLIYHWEFHLAMARSATSFSGTTLQTDYMALQSKETWYDSCFEDPPWNANGTKSIFLATP